MKYVEKGVGPDCLINLDVTTPWSEFQGECRKELVEIMFTDQKGLCAYCERLLRSAENKSETIDHMVPPSKLNPRADGAAFEGEIPNMSVERRRYCYDNLVLCCFGYPPPADDHSKPDRHNVSCNQYKADKFDDALFIYPTVEQNLLNFFVWDAESGEVSPSSRGGEKAQYMIDTLNLDCNYLRVARRNALEALIRLISADSGSINWFKTEILEGRQQFSSFLTSVLLIAGNE